MTQCSLVSDKLGPVAVTSPQSLTLQAHAHAGYYPTGYEAYYGYDPNAYAAYDPNAYAAYAQQPVQAPAAPALQPPTVATSTPATPPVEATPPAGAHPHTLHSFCLVPFVNTR